MFAKCCGHMCSSTGLALIFAVICIMYARVLADVANLAPAFSEQWYAELWWWTKFMLPFDAPAPLPISVLKHKHSSIDVLEFWVHNDSEAVTKFLENTGKKHDDKVVILRGVWANNTETPMKNWNSIEAFRKYVDTSKTYEALISPTGTYRGYEEHKLETVLEHLPDRDSLWGLIFDFTFLKTQDKVYDEYQNLWKQLDPRLTKRIVERQVTTHTFIYHGNVWRTQMHAASADDYFLQVSNRKLWRFVNKKYMPYTNTIKQSVLGVAFILGTPCYFAPDFPTDSVPYTEVTVGPGDLMWFPPWHWHEVLNKDDTFGMAYGIRTFDNPIDAFAPLTVYNLQGVGKLTAFKLILKWGYLYAKVVKYMSKPCKNRYGEDFGMSWNGTDFVRYDFRMVNGECQEVQRESGFQEKEILGNYQWWDWKPALY